MKKTTIKIILSVLLLIVFSSCTTLSSFSKSKRGGIDQPTGRSSSGIYGYIDFGENKGLFGGNLFSRSNWLDLYFYPINEGSDIDSDNLFSLSNFNMKRDSVKGLWLKEDKSFFISSSELEPGNYGLLLVCSPADGSNTIWFNPKNAIVSVKEGELSYWGAVNISLKHGFFESEAIVEVQNKISRRNVLNLMEERLIENGWESWLNQEKRHM